MKSKVIFIQKNVIYISCTFFPDFMYFEKTNNSEGDRPGMLDG